MSIPGQGNMLEVGQCKNPKSVDLIFFQFFQNLTYTFRTLQKMRIDAIVIAKNPKWQVAETSRLARRSLGVRAVW